MVAEKRYCQNPACGKELTMPPKCINWPKGKGKYCSRACTGKARSAQMKQVQNEIHGKRRAYIVEELDFLIGTDSPERLARRLGYNTVEGLTKACQREKREDLASKLKRQQRLIDNKGNEDDECSL